jgi:hypothetical protein
MKKRVSCKSEAVKRRLYVWCSYSETVIKSVARIRLVKSEKIQRVLVNCKVWKSSDSAVTVPVFPICVQVVSKSIRQSKPHV